MATFTFPITLTNKTGHVDYKVLYRVTGTVPWISFVTSGSSATISRVLDNTIYDLQVQNINNFDNELSEIVRVIGFTDPNPVLSPTNSTVAFSFVTPTTFITSYTVTIANAATPGTIIASQEFSAGGTISGQFTGLVNLTKYILAITVVAQEHHTTFDYTVITDATASCATPTAARAYLTSGSTTSNLHVSWSSPAILPTGGFYISYRRKGDNTYSSYITSGTTSGNTASLVVSDYTYYEGYVQSYCGGDSYSQIAPFGTNAYQQLSVAVTLKTIGNDTFYQVTITSVHSNPYDTMVAGSFVHTDGASNTITFSVTYDAGNTTQVILLPDTPFSSSGTISNLDVNSVAALFDNGGSLQQFDPLFTPTYFRFYWALNTSGTTWNGNPADLPSFTLDSFTVTETDTSGNVIAGTINFSWIYEYLYGGGTAPYDLVTLKIADPVGNVTMGTVDILTTPLGERRSSMNITKSTTAITPSNAFRLYAYWADATLIGAVTFYLPTF